ncbi:antA/AntB antirepressor family protein [Campylobacter coli]|uniref:antA/AntB antirepressor family protein n=1 Tax=Campylobacter coli TaxID=195 RepID=UPI002351BA26|nr:antA/AntB antirepressor family protein [Campylobacter coli]MDC8054047.1 antA/AntB antirepressor family protein [Campylobacter coli]MDC8078054.1 antA/AntB antirepressor family protein [Campylobacter coli]HEB9969005.1 antA/AntB antirepressor family protein [Campylobacter coli]HEB9984300.1 antA/AntB antirepressor family protein [Campylobacter coli]HED8484934.1 antA/AntB antirepressor family protein [Campylobacter coli]
MTNLIPLRHNNQILARDLHFFIDAKRQFANWINERIENYDFIENQDYAIELVYTKGRPRKEYYITLDMAKELCMVENNEKGRQARRYFIECEKRLKNIEAEQMQKLAFRQSLGYKSQLAQQKQKYENEIKALKYDLEHKKELSFKRKLSQKELLELRKILARDYGILCMKEWEMSLVAEKIGKDTVFEAVLNKLEKELKYWQNYDEYEEKWKKILRR